MNQAPPPHCPTCRHHYVTYEPQLPHGCRLFGIRTQALPAVIVRRDSGADCTHHEPKPRPGQIKRS